MNNNLQKNVQRLAVSFPPIMHLFHQLAGQVSKLGAFSLAQYRVMMLVYHSGPMSISTLKNKLGIAQSTASEMVERLVQQGLLEREKLKKDQRVTVFRLSGKAVRSLKKRQENMLEVYKQILEPLTAEEQEKLLQAFITILELTQRKE